MDAEQAAQFPLRPGLTMLNHSSVGFATTALLDRAEQVRREIESDPVAMLRDDLDVRLTAAQEAVCAWLGLDSELAALTSNATAGAAAVTRSLPLGPGDAVVILSSEYPSIMRGWQRRCEETGADLHWSTSRCRCCRSSRCSRSWRPCPASASRCCSSARSRRRRQCTCPSRRWSRGATAAERG